MKVCLCVQGPIKVDLFLKRAIPGLSFLFIFVPLKPTLQFLQQINVKTSIQYTVLEFEHTTYRIRVSSHNH